LTTTNKDLFDFVPSSFSRRYFGAADLPALLQAHDFSCQLLGAGRIDALPRRHRWLRPLKAAARRFGLVPRTMQGKALLRRMLFGPLARMPQDLSQLDLPYTAPAPIAGSQLDRSHRFLYAVAKRQG
jgi:hypothetical protein